MLSHFIYRTGEVLLVLLLFILLQKSEVILSNRWSEVMELVGKQLDWDVNTGRLQGVYDSSPPALGSLLRLGV